MTKEEAIEWARRPDTDCHLQGICQRSGYSIAQPVQEPVAQAIQDAAAYGVGISRDGKRIDPASIYAQPEPAQEPVAWGLFAKVGRDFVLQHPVRFSEADAKNDRLMYPLDTVIVIRPLYTAPPQPAQPVQEPFPQEAMRTTHEIARAIEAAHGIKE